MRMKSMIVSKVKKARGFRQEGEQEVGEEERKQQERRPNEVEQGE